VPMYDANDIIERKNREKRKRRLIRTIIIVILLLAAGAVYITQELWLPKLRGLGRQAQTIVNDGRLAEGNFPIELQGSGDYQLKYTGHSLALLSDAFVYFYNEDGALLKRRQHSYTNPVIDASNGRLLIFEIGGDEVSVEDETEVIYHLDFDNPIMFARLSPEGYTAVVTNSKSYDCEIFIYDRKGSCIYQRKCVEYVGDICFRDGSSGGVISYVNADKGTLVTKVQDVEFKENGEKWTSTEIDTFGLEVYGYDGGAFLLGMDACGYVNNDGILSSYYEYDGDLQGGSSENGQSAVIINNDDRRKYILALFDGGGLQPITIDLGQPLIDVTVADGLAYVMSQDSIVAYDFDGALRSTAQINDSYTGFVRSQENIYLKGRNKIDKINYES